MSWTNKPLTQAPHRMSASSAAYDPYQPYDPYAGQSHNRRQESVDSFHQQRTPPLGPSRKESADTLIGRPGHPSRDSSYTPYVSDSEKQSMLPSEQYDKPRPRPPIPEKQTSWTKAVEVGFWPRFIYVLAGIIMFGIWTGLVFFFVNKEKTHLESNIDIDLERYQTAYAAQNDISDWPMLQASLRDFDVSGRSLSVQWAAVHVNSDNKTFSPMITTEINVVENDNRLGVYRDILAVRDEAHDDPDNGYEGWKLDNATQYRIATLGMRDTDSVTTDIDMSGDPEKAWDVWIQPEFGYPWDRWQGSIIMVANWLVDAEAYNETGASVVSFSTVSLIDSVMNWKIEVQSKDTWMDDNSDGCELHVTFYATRPGVVKFVVILVVVVNWIVTISIFLLTGEAIILRRTHILEGTDILSVCFAALFALPTVRSLLPGAPDQFGALIDFVSILPNIIIISLCTTLVAAMKVARRIKDTWDAEGKRN